MSQITLFTLIFSLLMCQQNQDTITDPNSIAGYQIKEAFPHFKFTRPVDFQSPTDGRNQIYVVEQKGKIWGFDNHADNQEKYLFLDITDRVDDRSNEEGLLGLAFHPNFKENGYFFVNYTVSSSETLISRFQMNPNTPQSVDPTTEKILLRFDQPYGNHNGGGLAFGPDGFLYVGIGDGGSGGDPLEHGQNLNTLLGSIIRIDINDNSINNAYGIPKDNPWINQSPKRPEIYAYGLRNPWRISFDSQTGQLWCGDVGQNKYEEINLIVKGGNYGWNEMEGLNPFKSGKRHSSFIDPVVEIAQSTGDRSITGGLVYRGKKLPDLYGKYIFGDFVSGRIYVAELTGENKANHKVLIASKTSIASFGLDSNQEIYFCSFDGKIYTIVNE